MFDLHTHTVFSDGELIPAELARRAKVAGYSGIAFTDHVDDSNLETTLAGLLAVAREYGPHMGLDLLAGVELTHVPPGLVPVLVARARELGAQVVVVHGETVVEPVALGTNLAAIEAGADILAHPGLITEQDVRLAAERGVFLEITTRKGHSLANGHVLAMARKFGAGLVINNDAHAPGDLVSRDFRRITALGAGMTENEYRRAEANGDGLARKILAARGTVQA
ncbi:MAG: histidinol phosphate phosphatase domain-containing protein [Deltaproteobacteria bacterium]|nr:histidinol phosphate phosphatase domain-containing protein [Deltaproteobacteria bacterium]